MEMKHVNCHIFGFDRGGITSGPGNSGYCSCQSIYICIYIYIDIYPSEGGL